MMGLPVSHAEADLSLHLRPPASRNDKKSDKMPSALERQHFNSTYADENDHAASAKTTYNVLIYEPLKHTEVKL